MEPLFSTLGILKVEDIFKHQIASLMWDYTNNKLPECFQNYFTRPEQRHGHATRFAKSNKLCTDNKYTNNHGLSMFRCHAPKLWNTICDMDFYNSTLSKGLFRKKYKVFLLGTYSNT